MALADLAVSAQAWVEDEFRRSGSPGVIYLRDLADEVAGQARILVPRRTSLTFDSIHVQERVGYDGIHWFKVLARRPQVDVLDSAHGYIRNPGPRRDNGFTATGRRRRTKGTGSGVRPSHPFMREALFEVTKVF